VTAPTLKALQKPEESVRRPSTVDDTLLDGETSNPTRELITEQDPVTIAETVSGVVSQVKQILYGDLPGRWSDVPPLSLLEIQQLLSDQENLVMNCLATTAIGDLVFHSSMTDNTVITATHNFAEEPVMGYVIGKPTIVTAKIMYLGIAPTTLGRGKVFLGTDGKFTLTVPTTDYLQVLGTSFGDGRLLFKPALQRIKRN